MLGVFQGVLQRELGMMWEFFTHDSVRLPLNPSLEVVGIDRKVLDYLTTTANKLLSMAIIQVNLRKPDAPPVKNWRILLVQSFTACMPLLTATSTFRLGRRHWSSPQQCYLHCLYTHLAVAVLSSEMLLFVLSIHESFHLFK